MDKIQGMSEFLAADYLNLWWKIHNKNVNQGFPVQVLICWFLEVWKIFKVKFFRKLEIPAWKLKEKGL